MFTNREEAGRQLAQRLLHVKDEHADGVVVLGLPRGGVVVAAEIARVLDAPLDVLVVRKLGAPGQPELAIGAVTNGEQPQQVLNQQVIHMLGVSEAYLQEEIGRQLVEVRRRQELYRGGRPAVRLEGRTVIVADDGIATGATVRAGVQALRRSALGRIVLTVPVAPPEVAESLRTEVDQLVCLHTPSAFGAVGAFYADFFQTSDAEVIALLEQAAMSDE
ncbi:MAG: phosphoribosyltransferase [Planctomycetes bacterium]|nr:phosphoribosyltransferase [Planctomycetota bacterium]